MTTHGIMDVDAARTGPLHLQDEQPGAGADHRIDDQRAVRHDDRLGEPTGAQRQGENPRDLLVVLGDDDGRTDGAQWGILLR